MQRFRASLSTVSLLLLAACGGGGGSHALPAVSAPAPSPSSPSTSALARFTLTIPAKTVASSKRAPNYISANTQSAIITLTTVNGVPFTGISAETAANLTTSNAACSGSPLTCSIAVPAAPGTDVFTVALYDQPQTSASPATPAGNLLSTASVSVTVTAGQNNSPATPLVLEGVPAAIVATFATDAATTAHVSGSVASGFSIVGNRPYSVTISTQDASGNTIVGEGAPTLTSSTSAVVLTNVSGSTYTIRTASYSSGPVSITASTPTGTAPSFTITTIPELWVAEPGASLIAAYALFPNCSPACPSIAGDAIEALGNPVAVAFDASGDLWASDRQTDTVNEFTVGASPTATPAAVIGTSTLNNPYGLAFDPSGNVWVTDLNTKTVYDFPAQNGATPLQTITGVNNPQNVAFDANGNLWILGGLQMNSLSVYEYNAATATATGVQAPVPLRGSSFFTFDTASDMWLAGNTSGDVIKFAAPVSSSSTVAATVSSGLTEAEGVAVDPAGNLWVADLASQTIKGYKSANAATAFATISLSADPFGIAILP